MESIGTFFKWLFTLPLDQYWYDGERDWFATIFFGTIIYGITGLIVGIAADYARRKITWLTKRQHCQHAECGNQWTMDVNDTQQPNCYVERACCSSCQERHYDEARQREADGEQKLDCPHGCGKMEKDIIDDVIHDICPTCDFVGLGSDELQQVKQIAYDQGHARGYSEGKASGRNQGLATGVAVGMIIDSD